MEGPDRFWRGWSEGEEDEDACRRRWARAVEAESRSGQPHELGQRLCSRLLLPAARATEITTTSNFLQEPHTGGEKISQAFPMKSFPQALPTPRASWLGAGPSSFHLPPGCAGRGSSRGVQNQPRLRAHSCPRPLTSPRNVLLPFTKHLYSPPA